MTSFSRTSAAVLLTLTLLAGCGGSSSDAGDDPAPATDRGAEGSGDEGDGAAPDLGRVVVLGEEALYADVAALGVEPVAASASVPEAGFQGMDDVDTSEVEVLSMTELDLEEVAALRPDLIVTYQFWVDQAPSDQLQALGELLIVPDGLSPEEQVETLGRELGREDEADALLADLDEARTAAREQVGDGCELSLATIYSGPSVAAWTDGPWAQPTAILDLGCTLVPDKAAAPPVSNGRAYLSDEQLELLDGPTMLLLQTSSVDGEDAAVEAIEANPLWERLPAVEDDRVVVLDRLGYPGARGLVRFFADAADALSA